MILNAEIPINILITRYQGKMQYLIRLFKILLREGNICEQWKPLLKEQQNQTLKNQLQIKKHSVKKTEDLTHDYEYMALQEHFGFEQFKGGTGRSH